MFNTPTQAARMVRHHYQHQCHTRLPQALSVLAPMCYSALAPTQFHSTCFHASRRLRQPASAPAGAHANQRPIATPTGARANQRPRQPVSAPCGVCANRQFCAPCGWEY